MSFFQETINFFTSHPILSLLIVSTIVGTFKTHSDMKRYVARGF